MCVCVCVCDWFSGSRRRHRTRPVLYRLTRCVVQTASGNRYRLVSPSHDRNRSTSTLLVVECTLHVLQLIDCHPLWPAFWFSYIAIILKDSVDSNLNRGNMTFFEYQIIILPFGYHVMFIRLFLLLVQLPLAHVCCSNCQSCVVVLALPDEVLQLFKRGFPWNWSEILQVAAEELVTLCTLCLY